MRLPPLRSVFRTLHSERPPYQLYLLNVTQMFRGSRHDASVRRDALTRVTRVSLSLLFGTVVIIAYRSMHSSSARANLMPKVDGVTVLVLDDNLAGELEQTDSGDESQDDGHTPSRNGDNVQATLQTGATREMVKEAAAAPLKSETKMSTVGESVAATVSMKMDEDPKTRVSAELAREVGEPPFLHPHSTCDDVSSWVPEADGLPLMLQLVNQGHLRMQSNFMLLMKKNSSFPFSNFFLLCIDEKSALEIEMHFGIRCVRVKGVMSTRKDKKLGTHRNYQIWNFRTKVLACLVDLGRDVLMSDNDALWLRDPLPDLQNTPGHLVISRGHWPPEYADPRYGTTLCMGFALFRAGSPLMSMLLRILRRHVASFGDDQIGVNLAVQQLLIQWEYGPESDMRYTNSTRVGSAVVDDPQGQLHVTYLPHSKYTRDCEATPISSETIVAHCFPRYHREEAMRNASLWFAT